MPKRSTTPASLGRAIVKVKPSYEPPPKKVTVDAETARALRAFDGLQNIAAALGTSRDKRSQSCYAQPHVLSRYELENAYRGSWVAGRIVDTPAEDMTREWVKLSWDNYDTDQNNVKAIETEEKRLGLRSKVTSGLKWGRLYGGGAGLIIIKNEKDHSKPLDVTKIKKGDFQALHILDRWWVAPSGEMDYDPTSPNFGLPKFYVVSGTQGEMAPRVHWSRIVRFEGRELPKNLWLQNGYWHDSELQHVIDSVQDYDATKGGIASMVFEANVDIIMQDGLAELAGTADGDAKIVSRLVAQLMMKSYNHTLLLDKALEDYKQKTTQFSGVVEVFREFMVDVCGAAKIPMTRLFHQSAPGLTSTGDNDLVNYYDEISVQQESNLRSPLEYLYEIVVRSALGSMPKNFKLEFSPLWQQSDKELADTELVRAQRDKLYHDMFAIDGGLVARELKDRRTYRTQEDKDVALAEELAKELPEPTAVPGQGAPPSKGAPAPTAE